MKKVILFIVTVCLFGILSSCSLKLQKDEPYKGVALDPHENMTAWEFLQSRPDLFASMSDALVLCGVDQYYKQTSTKYTFLPFVEEAIKPNLDAVKADPSLIPALKDTLMFHIIKDEYHGYGTLDYSVKYVETLLGGDDVMSMTLYKNQGAELDIDRVQLMTDCGSSSIVYSIGCNHLCTNGPVHVMGSKCIYVK